MGIVKAVCVSEKKGTEKTDVKSGKFVINYGIEQDAHGGNWHRQVSLLSYEKFAEFQAKGAPIKPGAFGENLLVEGFDFRSLPVPTFFKCNDVILEMTQIGKECHSHCQIYKRMGDCIMPREGVFAQVLQGGTISVGDEMTIVENVKENKLRAAVVTLSDKGSRNEREDTSGPLIRERLEEAGYEVVEMLLLPDERIRIEMELKRLADSRQVDLILTTGGTGFSARDCTPEATMAVATRNAPGIAEAIRAYSMQFTKRAMFSRGASVIRGRTLIVNLPGSAKAVRESLDCFLPHLDHGLEILKGTASECGGGTDNK